MIPRILDDALDFNIDRVSLLFRREFYKVLQQYAMTQEHWQILLTLWTTKKPLKQTEIVALTLKDKSTVSRILQKMEKEGWILKMEFEDDQRVTLIRPTRKSWKLYQEVPQKLRSHFKMLLIDFPQAKEKEMLNLLQELRRILEE